MSITNDFCCERMMFAAEDIDSPLRYKPKLRYYSMSAPKSLLKKNAIWVGYTVDFCPYCGAKVPKDLVDEYFEILEKEYDITDPYETKQKKRIPAEFMSDEWWKKREL